LTSFERRARIKKMVELKHRQQWRRANRLTGLATMRPQSRPLASVVKYQKETKEFRRTVGKRRRTPEAGRAMIATTYARKSTDQAIADEEIR
jgi:hypothetical protein